MMRWRKNRQRQSSPLVAYLDWSDDEQRELCWHAGYLDNRTIIPRSTPAGIGDQIEALRNTYPHVDALAYVRTGQVVNVMHPHVSRLATVALLDTARLRLQAEQNGMVEPTVVIAPSTVITLAEEEDARRLAAELTVAYAILPLPECAFAWQEESR